VSDEPGVVEIGNAHGKIAIYCDEDEAINIASHYPYPDVFGREILAAVEKAYPKDETES
jgi:hypothetical protein